MRSVIEQGGGVKTVIAVEDGALVTGTVQDATPIAEVTKAMHNEGRHGSSDMKLAASVPMVLVEKYCNDAGISFAEFMGNQDHKKRLLNDPAIAHFRVWKGRV